MPGSGHLCLLLLLLALPVSAEVEIQDLLVHQRNNDVNVRVVLYNPSPAAQEGPIGIDLFVRADESAPWDKLRTWTDIRVLAPGNRVARDLFAENSERLKQLAAAGRFEVRTTVTVRDLRRVAERKTVYQRP